MPSPSYSRPRRILRRPGASRRSGAVLVYGLVAVLTVGALAAASFEVVSALSRRQARALDTKLAFYMAEAGLAEGRTGVLLGRSGAVGTESEPAVFGEGLFWVEATPLGTDLVRLESTGMVGSGLAKLSMVLARGSTDVASLGVFSQSDLVITPGSTIDWFNSATGESATSGGTSAAGARLGSNQNVVVQATPSAPTTVIGDLVAGPGATFDVAPDATVKGSMENAVVARNLPRVEVPPVPMRVGVTHTSAVPFVVPPGEWGSQYLQLGQGANVVLTGPMTLVLGELQLAPGANLEFDTSGGPIRVVVQNDLDMAPGAHFACSGGDPRNTNIEVAGAPPTPIQLLGNGPYQGVFYAPDADVLVADTFEVFGAIVAGSLAFQGAPLLHFDEHLLSIPAEVLFPTVVSWRLVELANAGPPGSDPFSRLGLDPVLLPEPKDAHEDTPLELKYVDLGGVTRSYSGMESGFDWSNVSEVLAASRNNVDVPPLGSTAGSLQVVDPIALQLEADALAYIAGESDQEKVAKYVLQLPRVTDAILEATTNHVPPLESKKLRDVLRGWSPLSDSLLSEAVQSPLDDAHLREVLVQNSPLNTRVLDAVINRVPAISAGELAQILAAQ